jgi:2-C-methyl-D-erythritol 4-phosphate cytidylyltransferase
LTQLLKYVIIVAGGTGTRMNSVIPKQFLEINGLPILMHTIRKFAECIEHIKIIVVLPEIHIGLWKALCEEHQFKIPHQVVTGGETRFYSVKNGLATIHLGSTLQKDALVAVHDAVRPLVSKSTIINTFEMAEKKGNAIPAIRINESIREVSGQQSKAVDRDNFFVIQTPQCFLYSQLTKAYQQDYVSSFTDDATVVETNGELIHLVEGNPENIKITTPKDLNVATMWLNQQG